MTVSSSGSRLGSLRDRLLIGVGLGALLLPTLAMPWVDREARARELKDRERRPAASFGVGASWERLPKVTENAFADQIGLRTPLLHLTAGLRWDLLGEAWGSEVVRGNEGWLFLHNGQHLDHWRGATTMTGSELQAWVAMFDARRSHAAELGARYVVALLPAKGTVYPEYAPEAFPRVGPSRRDQVCAALDAHGIEVLDLTASLLEAKADDDPSQGDFLYHRFGPHWSGRGERVATEALVEAVGLPRLQVRWELRPGGREHEDNWGRRTYVEASTPDAPLEWWPSPELFAGELIPGAPMESRRYERLGGAAPRVVMHHDSFGRGVREQLGTVASLLAIWSSHFDHGRASQFRPDIVLDWYVEWRVAGDPERVHVDGPREWEASWSSGEQLWWSLRSGGGGLARVIGQREESGPVDDPLRITSDGSPAMLVLEGLPELRVDSILRLDLEAPAEGFLELTYLVQEGGPPRRRDTTRVQVPAGRGLLLIPVRSERLLEDHLGLYLGGAKGAWRLHGAQIREVSDGVGVPGTR